jgi:hypothetical protein
MQSLGRLVETAVFDYGHEGAQKIEVHAPARLCTTRMAASRLPQ